VAKKIVYGSHAEEKFELLRKHGFVVSKRQLQRPEKIEEGFRGRKVAQRRISEKGMFYESSTRKGRGRLRSWSFIRGEEAAMRVRHNRKEDILILELSKASIDHAEEAGPIIAHFSTEDKLVLLEILEASDFLAHLTKATMKAEGRGSVEL
jgi:hypothetical protein